jgi:tetratricopeptide (TPR) repeat protein
LNKRQNSANWILLSLMLLSLGVMGQITAYNRAVAFYQEKKFDQARVCIDSAAVNPETTKDPIVWLQRAFIYYELYKAKDRQIANGKAIDVKINSSLRDTSVQSIRMVYALTPDLDTKTNADKLFGSYTNSYYRMANTFLTDSSNSEKSEKAFEKHLEMTKYIDPKLDIRARELEYFKAVGSHFAEKFNLNGKDTSALRIAKVALMKAIDRDGDGYSANFNLGVLYFNQGSNLVRDMGIPTIEELEISQANAEKLFRQAEPFLLKALKINPKSKPVLEGLERMYRWLNDYEKSEFFLKKLKELGN